MSKTFNNLTIKLKLCGNYITFDTLPIYNALLLCCIVINVIFIHTAFI